MCSASDHAQGVKKELYCEFLPVVIVQYHYDNLGRRTNVSNSGTAFSSNKFNEFGYNDRSELTGSNRYTGNLGDTSQPISAEARAYAYDPIGNRKTATEAAKQLTYTANQLNQYTLITSPVEASPGYDADGNLTTAPAESGVGLVGCAARTVFNYDAENRLISVAPETLVDGATKIDYVYDYMSRRAQKKVSTYTSGSWSLTTSTTYLYDGWNLIREVSPQNAEPTSYIWGLDLSGSMQGAGGIGGLLARVKDGQAQQYTFDGNGNVSELLNADGSIAAHYEYDPFGNAIVATGSDNPFRYSTKYTESETGLLYYGYRYYSPVLGRWLSRDPLGENASLNLSLFNRNNSVNLIDPNGLLAYTAYRELALPTGHFLWKLAQSAGHVYIAFKVAGPDLSEKDRDEWCKFLHKKGYQRKAGPISGQKEYDEWITFSYHPIAVGSKISPNEGNLLSTLITTGSFIDLNNQETDIDAILWDKATLNLVSSDINVEFKFFERIEKSMADKGRDFSRPFSSAMPKMLQLYNNYGFLRFNCGGWAKYVIDESQLKWPLENKFYNLGVGVGGPMEPVAFVLDVALRTIYSRGIKIDF